MDLDRYLIEGFAALYLARTRDRPEGEDDSDFHCHALATTLASAGKLGADVPLLLAIHLVGRVGEEAAASLVTKAATGLRLVRGDEPADPDHPFVVKQRQKEPPKQSACDVCRMALEEGDITTEVHRHCAAKARRTSGTILS